MKKIISKLLIIFLILNVNIISLYAADESASVNLSFHIDEYIKIEPITSPVLIANITDKTGNLNTPLSTKFRVISNSYEKKTLYLKSNVITEGGYEESMFEAGGRVYIAFANLSKLPKSTALINCKAGGKFTDSPGIVAYPITSIYGAKSDFNKGKNKYEITVENGTTFVSVNVGANVLPASYGPNDPQGFYQAILSLTEADI